MSSDEESINNDLEASDNEQQNDVIEVGDDLQDQTEEVQKDETAEAEAGGDEDRGKTAIKPKRAVRNPQPKLNAETLKGPKGIAALESYFERVQFKGKGKEHQDLNVIMKTYEYWCHRLFPKFPFDTCIERLEKLGYKRAVQTHVKRIRFDLFVEDKPILNDSDEEPNVEGFVNIEDDEINQQQNKQFDQLLSSSAPVTVMTPLELTAEQLERIQLNKEKAERLRQERLKKIRDKTEENLQTSSQLPGTSGLQNEAIFEIRENTQSDIFSQENFPSASASSKNTHNLLDDKEGKDELFNHESNIKGKISIKGGSIKKKSNKQVIVVNNDLEKSDGENVEDHIQNRDTILSNDIELLDIDHNSSDTGFGQKKRNKRNTILDSDDDQSVDEEVKKTKDGSRSVSPKYLNANNDGSDEENSVESNIANKQPAQQSTLRDTDESGQDMEQMNRPFRITMSKKTKKKENDLESNDSDQEMDQIHLCEVNNSDGLSINSNNYLLDVSALENDSNSSLPISSSAKNSNIETDDSLAMPKVVEVDAILDNDEESMEIIESELEALLKSTT